MYENIGGKIKGLAKAVFVIETIITVIAGFILIAMDEDLSLLGFFLLIVGPLISWLLSLLLYGFGELIDKASEIERNTRSGEKKSETQARIDSERVNKIEKLRSQGLITEEEYQQIINKGL